MFVETVTTVTIDPVEDFNVCQEYRRSPDWRIICETSECIVFEYSTGITKYDTPFFIDSEDGGDG